MNKKTENPNELTIENSVTKTDAINRTAQEILAAFEAKDAAKVNSYYAPDAVIATMPATRQPRTAGPCPRPSRTILRIPTSR